MNETFIKKLISSDSSMKVLRLIYIMLSLAIADVGWLIARLGSMTPSKFSLSFPSMVIGIPILLAGVTVGMVCLVSLIWLVIAYAPQQDQVSTKKIKSTITILLVFIAFDGTAHYILRPHPSNSQITFDDSAIAVQDSMKVLRQLCESVETNQFLSCHVRCRDNTLFFSVPITRNIESLSENLGRIDTVTLANSGFRYMKKETIIRLLSVVKFLNRNQIAGIVHDVSIGVWRYPYGIDCFNENQWFNQDKQENQYLYIYNFPKDTVSAQFKYYLSIKDRKEQMVLIKSKDVPYRIFR